MKTAITFLLPMIISIATLAQEKDSSIYKKYYSVKNVIEVKYIKNYYSNGKLESEGWAVLEKSSAESEIIRVKNWRRYDMIDHKFGIWKRYYKNGSLAGIDSNGINIGDVSKQYEYDKNECLTKVSIMKPAVSLDKAKRWTSNSLDEIEWLNYRYYDCKGIIREENFKKKYAKTGVWKWYENGVLIKTKEYRDNKLIEEKKLN